MYYNSFLYLLFYFFIRVFRPVLTEEQTLLQHFAGEKYSAEEAKRLCERINDHKWYLSEKLHRDVGYKVAAIDYLENFYQSEKHSSKRKKGRVRSNLQIHEMHTFIA